MKIQYLQDECNRAKESPAYQNTFRRLHLNQWTEQATRFLDMDAWDECGGQVDSAELEGCSCWAGLDLASTIDITAFVLCFANEDGGYTWLPFFWVPEEAIQKRSTKDRVQYDVWKKREFLESTPGNVCDHDHIRERIKQMAEVYRIQEIAYDRWNASQLVTQLMNDGATMVPFGQGYQSMNAPTKELLTLVTGRKLRHGGNPVLRWMASNMAAKQDPADNLKCATFSSIEHQSLEFIRNTIRPWLVRWEQDLTRDLFPAEDRDKYFVEFLIDGLMRGDLKSRYDSYAIGRNNGWLSANDIRRLENIIRCRRIRATST